MLDDNELARELDSARWYLQQVERRGAGQGVVKRARLELEILEELVLWRQNGRKWLEYLNDKSGTLSDAVFAGKEKNGKVLKSKATVNKAIT